MRDMDDCNERYAISPRTHTIRIYMPSYLHILFFSSSSSRKKIPFTFIQLNNTQDLHNSNLETEGTCRPPPPLASLTLTDLIPTLTNPSPAFSRFRPYPVMLHLHIPYHKTYSSFAPYTTLPLLFAPRCKPKYLSTHTHTPHPTPPRLQGLE